MAKLLFGVSAVDPLTFTINALLLTLVALAASFITMRCAMRVYPMVAPQITQRADAITDA
jgi:hypothetical protein